MYLLKTTQMKGTFLTLGPIIKSIVKIKGIFLLSYKRLKHLAQSFE